MQQFDLGSTADGELDFPFLRESQNNLMTEIYGRTGSGKSALMKIMVEEAAINGIPSFVLSAKEDIHTLISPHMLDQTKSQTPFDEHATVFPFSFVESSGVKVHFPIFPSKESVSQYEPGSKEARTIFANAISNYIEYAHEEASDILRRDLKLFYNTLFDDLYEKGVVIDSLNRLEEVISRSNIVDPILNQLKLNTSNFRKTFTNGPRLIRISTNFIYQGGYEFDVASLVQPIDGKTPVSLISLNKLDEKNRYQVMRLVLEEIYNYYNSQNYSSNVEVIVVIDEASLFCPTIRNVPTKGIIKRLVLTARDAGVVTMVISQGSRQLDKDIRNNMGISILGQSNPDEITEVYTRLKDKMPESITKQELINLEAREFLLVSDHLTTIFRSRDLLTHFKPADVNDGRILMYRESLTIPLQMAKKTDELEDISKSLDSLVFELEEEIKQEEEEKVAKGIEKYQINFKQDPKADTELFLTNHPEIERNLEVNQRAIVYLPYALIQGTTIINSFPQLDNVELGDINMDYEVKSLNPMFNSLDLPEKLQHGKITSLSLSGTPFISSSYFDVDQIPIILASIELPDDEDSFQESKSLKKFMDSKTLRLNRIKSTVQADIHDKALEILSVVLQQATEWEKFDHDRQLVQNEIDKIEKKVGQSTFNGFMEEYRTDMAKIEKLQRRIEREIARKKDPAPFKDHIESIKKSRQFWEHNKERYPKLLKARENLQLHLDKLPQPPVSKKTVEGYIETVKEWILTDDDLAESEDELLVLYVPFIINYGVHSILKQRIFLLQELVDRSPIYMTCNACMEEQWSQQDHNSIFKSNISVCSDDSCAAINCVLHSFESNYSHQRFCKDNMVQCQTCGYIDRSEGLKCENCGDTYCNNHLTKIGKMFRGERLLCAKCNND